MAPGETENNAYAKFWSEKRRVLWYVMVFSGVVNSRSFPSCQKKAWKMSILIIRTFDLGDR